MCRAVQSTYLDKHKSRGSPSIFYRCGVCPCSFYLLVVQIPYCHQSTKKGEVVRAYLSLIVLVIDDNAFYGLIVCVEYFRHLITTHKMSWCPSKTIEDGVSLRFFSVDLSHRKAVLLRGGPLWKGLGGIITYTSTPFAPPFLWHFGASSVFSRLCKLSCLLSLGMR